MPSSYRISELKLSYKKNILQSINPKIIITQSDHDQDLYNFKKYYGDKFKIIVIQRAVLGSHFKKFLKNKIIEKKTSIDYFFTFGNYDPPHFKKYLKGTKFFVISNRAPNKQWAIRTFSKKMKSSGIHTKQMKKPETLELAKILCDTSYLGWLINYAQLTNMIAINHNVNYDEMWTFSDEIHQFLGNRPKMYPGFIGGHCVIPNLDLVHDKTLDHIKKINALYSKKVKNSKSIHKKYTK